MELKVHLCKSISLSADILMHVECRHLISLTWFILGQNFSKGSEAKETIYFSLQLGERLRLNVEGCEVHNSIKRLTSQFH